MSRSGVAAALAAVVLAGASLGLRLVDLGGNPKGFFCDEASIAFNARSLVETGRDEHGVLLPVFFRAFGDYKPPFYVYATTLMLDLVPDVHLATRLPAAIFLSSLLLPVFAILRRRHGIAAAGLGVAWLALQPWLNQASHIAFGLSATPLLLATAFWLWLRFIDGSVWALRLATVVFALAFYSYPAARAFVPLFVLGLVWTHRAAFARPGGRRRLAEMALIAVVMSVPFLMYAFRAPGFFDRTRYLNVVTSPYVTNSGAYRWLEPRLRGSGLGDAVLDHDVVLRPLVVAMNYAAYYSPRYLFVSGDANLKFGTTAFGLYGPAAALGLVAGILGAALRRDPIDRDLLLWLALYGLPGSLTWEEVPHAGRGIVGHPGLDLLVVAGFVALARGLWQAGRKGRVGLVAAAATVLTLEAHHTVRYYRYYWNEYSAHASAWMQYGYRDMMGFVAAHHDRYPHTLIVTSGMHYLPEVFALLYSGTSPAAWQRTRQLPWGITVRRDLPPEAEWRSDTLYVLAPIPADLDPRFERLGTVKWESGGAAFGYFALARPES